MTIRQACTKKETKRVPRRRAPTLRIAIEKTIAPKKNDAIETRDFSQPQGLLDGWLEAPKPRKMVFPVSRGLLVLRLCWLWPGPLRDRPWDVINHTSLHAEETGPCVVGTAIA